MKIKISTIVSGIYVCWGYKKYMCSFLYVSSHKDCTYRKPPPSIWFGEIGYISSDDYGVTHKSTHLRIKLLSNEFYRI